jgi:hypothetical protein
VKSAAMLSLRSTPKMSAKCSRRHRPLYGWAGEQSDIHNRGGNYADAGIGRMDCIDHSTSTTRLLLKC